VKTDRTQNLASGRREVDSAIPTGDSMEFVFDTRSVPALFVERIWRTHSERAGTFMSEAAGNWELVITTFEGTTTVGVRGPETKASEADFPADAEFLGITFKLGTFMPHLPVKPFRDRQDMILPQASRNSFWLHGSVWERPTFENADMFVNRLIRQELLVRDPVVEAVLQGHTPDISLRSLQYRFVRATGLTHKTIQQIERARRAVALLEQGRLIVETAFELGYFDQAHLTNSLKRFIGKTPAQIAERSSVT
jgi:hypothetical protein